jgi:hypothetical protein
VPELRILIVFIIEDSVAPPAGVRRLFSISAGFAEAFLCVRHLNSYA